MVQQLYNWFKNSVGRNRRKAEGKPRSSRKTPEKDMPIQVARTPAHDPWMDTSPTISIERDFTLSDNTLTSSPTMTNTYSHHDSPAAVTPSPTVTARLPIHVQYPIASTLANALQRSPSSPPCLPQAPALLPPALPVIVTIASLTEAFLSNIDVALLASQMQVLALAEPPPLTLQPVIFALFQATSSEWDRSNTPPNTLLTRFLGAVRYFTSAVCHAGATGPLAGALALQMQIRKSARWTSTAARSHTEANPASSMSLELHRITADRARRKDHMQWARIHSSAIETGVFALGCDMSSPPNIHDYTKSRVFSDLFVQDAIWEEDEVEWVAGSFVLRSLIRTAMRGDAVIRRHYEELLVHYENRWKVMKDETRQAFVTEALLSAKAHLASLAAP
ncbi:unnamed protein product [Mycena citricolor]|nr:unnamed protein product [Mycena citricolor]